MESTQSQPPADDQNTGGVRRRFDRNSILVASALAVILVVALALRLYGIDWDEGYGHSPHPDERNVISLIEGIDFPSPGELDALLDAESSPWNPGRFAYGSFPLYLFKIAHSLIPTDVYDVRTIGRGMSALADVGVVFLTYLLGARLYGRRQGLLAAALVSLAVIHIQLSHFLTFDIVLGLTTIAALYFMHRVAVGGRMRDSVIAGVIVGLGLATKVSMAPMYLALAMAHLLYIVPVLGAAEGDRNEASRRIGVAFTGLLAAGCASLATFIIVQPYAIIDVSRFVADITEQSEMVRRIRDYPYTRQYIDTAAYLYHVRQLAAFGLGWPLGVVAWAGLLYASLRGMRFYYGLVYLVVGWLIPMGLLLISTGIVFIAAASMIAFAALVATLGVRSRESRGTVLLLSWVVPYLLVTGAFQVKFTRYLIPVTPLLILFGAQMLFHLWQMAASYRRWLRHVAAAAMIALVAVTGLYALAYTGVYQVLHTAVRSSEWLNQNAPADSVILMEHWEEGIPDMGRYEVPRLPVYENDTPHKLDGLAADLARADYILFYSNRLYGTITRLPERYPVTSAYYWLLFGGELGYRLANVETSYPNLAGVTLVDDTYGRPGLPTPQGQEKPPGLNINLGYADESFSAYDHPKGLVFENVERLDVDTIRERILDAAGDDPFGLEDFSASNLTAPKTVGLLLSEDDLSAQRAGGTWTDIVNPDGIASRMPVVAWLVVMQLMALAVLPIAFAVFRSLPDGGYLLAKLLGILVVSLVAWMLASLQWMAFSFGAVLVGIGVVGLASCVVLTFTWSSFCSFFRERWRVIAICELVFIAAFLAFVVVRMANPDLWHQWQGGEKPMDTAYLNAVLKSSFMPPYDPWYAGGYLNYYYWGQFIVASFIHATGIDTAVAVNLAVPMFFALTVGGAFSVVYNLAEAARAKLSPRPVHRVPEESSSKGASAIAWSPVLAGLAAALFVTVIGNLDSAIQSLENMFSFLMNEPLRGFDFWRSSRMMPPDPPGNEITEFPFFTFLFADLHAHLMAMPFTVLVIGAALAVVLRARNTVRENGRLARMGWGIADIAQVAVLGVAVGALRPLNTWDYPTYLLLSMAAVLLAGVLRTGGVNLLVIVEAAIKGVLIFLIGIVVFLPYHVNYETAFSNIEATTNQTVLWQFLLIAGLFVFVIGSFVVNESRGWLTDLGRIVWRPFSKLVEVPERTGASNVARTHREWIGVVRLALVVLGLGAIGLVVVLKLVEITGSTTPFVFALVVLALATAVRTMFSMRQDAPQTVYSLLLALTAFCVVIGVDIYRVEGDIDRMNTVFKFYLQIWVLLALASAYMLWRLWHRRSGSLDSLPNWKKIWLGCLGVLLVCVSVYPVLGTHDRLGVRFDTAIPLTLDGMAYMRDGQLHSDQRGTIDLTADYEAIRWIQQNVEGSPVILEAVTPTYRWGGRISIYTGLPNIVGWEWHQEQQRLNYRETVDQRIREVARIYNTPSPQEALDIMRKYDVEYVYLGRVEQLYYDPTGLAKFDTGLDGALEQVYENRDVRVFRVRE